MATSQNYLFPSSLIPQEMKESQPMGFTMRSLEKGDFAKGFLDCLRVLTFVGELSEQDFLEHFEDMVSSNGTYFVLVVEHASRIVATGTLVVEKKL
ncbi:hypothetical protein LTR62_005904 [Meristemomyces frigidus]|uniref:Glucosamine 6-phosphate N-acetyltransferase n=1 Tax=Meristemomyces frigidus TaxID=1508187 RepID=A0AAN7YJQ7_9PEZI|nr:hypothetical protein LTR62_005904 [Meristemomyces frigidus]